MIFNDIIHFTSLRYFIHFIFSLHFVILFYFIRFIFSLYFFILFYIINFIHFFLYSRCTNGLDNNYINTTNTTTSGVSEFFRDGRVRFLSIGMYVCTTVCMYVCMYVCIAIIIVFHITYPHFVFTSLHFTSFQFVSYFTSPPFPSLHFTFFFIIN